MTTRRTSALSMENSENQQPAHLPAKSFNNSSNISNSKPATRCRTAFIDITNAVGKGLQDGKKGLSNLGVRKSGPLKSSGRTASSSNGAASSRRISSSSNRAAATAAKLQLLDARELQQKSGGVKRTAALALAATASELASKLSRSKKSKKLRSIPTLSDLPSAINSSVVSTISNNTAATTTTVITVNSSSSGFSTERSTCVASSSVDLSDEDDVVIISVDPSTCSMPSQTSASTSSLLSSDSAMEVSLVAAPSAVDLSEEEGLGDSCSSGVSSLEARRNADNAARSDAARLPHGVIDFDTETEDLYAVSLYAAEVFQYYKQCESRQVSVRYLESVQPDLTEMMRSILVDWMVEVQESFELNHETLYLAVRLVDLYLGHVTVARDTLQLVGATALFIACKFDERLPPPLDDFLYICEDAYTRHEVIHTEMKMLRVVDFQLGIPISYRFLRRYARCCKLSMEVLTLSRYILETSLMEYQYVFVPGSRLAAAALCLALLMKQPAELADLLPTIQYYSGFQLAEFRPEMDSLNVMLHKPANSHLKTIRAKYSHRVFFEVAKVTLLDSVNV